MKTKKSHFHMFRAECLHWIKKFGLLDWDISIIRAEIDDSANASVGYNVCSRGAVIHINKKISCVDEKNFVIKQNAFHESCHLLLADLMSLAEKANMDQADKECHKIIERLSNSYFRDYYT